MGSEGRTKKHGEEETTNTNEKRTRKLSEVMGFSHTDSTTSVSEQGSEHSESCECPLSTRNHLIPDTMMISSRRASLRSSSKRPIETEITALSRCSQPQNSIEHSSSTYFIPHLDHHLTCQVPEGGDEKSLSNPSTHEKESFVEPISMAGRPSPSFSPKLTELVDMVDDKDDEVDSVTQTVDEYKVKPESMPILRKILSKHGDIVKNCTASTMEYRSVLLEMICDIISELKEKDFTKIKEDYLHKKIAVVNEIKRMKVDVEWLHLRLDEMLEARKILQQCGMLKEKKENNRKTIEDAESKLEECEERKKEVAAKFRAICDEETVCKETLARAMDESSRINETVKYATSKVKRFLHCSPVDDLL